MESGRDPYDDTFIGSPTPWYDCALAIGLIGSGASWEDMLTHSIDLSDTV